MTIRVLQIIKGLDIGGDSGGAELFGVKLARELNKVMDCEVWICAFYSVDTDVERNWQTQLQEEGIKTFFVSEWAGYNNLRKFIKGILNLFRELSNIKLDVAHSHFQLGTLAAIILKFFQKTKTAYRTSHIRKEWDQGKWTGILSPLFMKRIFPNYLDGEVGVSQAVCDYLLERRPGKIDSKKIHLIYNGIDVKQIATMGKEDLSPDDEPLFLGNNPVIGCVGRLSIQKGYHYLIKAMADVIKEFPDCKLHIVGDGELLDELMTLTEELDLSDHIKFLGLRSNVHVLLKRWNIFVLPSLWEGLPTVVMEAMVAQIPVIATDIPGTTELVIDRQTGVLVPPKNSKELCKAITSLLNNQVLQKKLVTNATSKLVQFNIKTIAQQYYSLYFDNN